VRDKAIAAVGPLVAPGGTLLVLAAAATGAEDSGTPPWPLTRAEVDAFAGPGLNPVRVAEITDDQQVTRWLAEFRADG
jgi:hypothetical protein